jgi:hypothetical protein
MADRTQFIRRGAGSLSDGVIDMDTEPYTGAVADDPDVDLGGHVCYPTAADDSPGLGRLGYDITRAAVG